VSTSADIEAIVGQLCLPIVVKPAETKYSAGLKARYFDSYEGLLSWARTHPDSGQYLVQEYCPGEGVGIEILMHDGVCTAMFQHRRLKEQPPSGGVAVMAVAESPDPVLAQASLRLLREMEWEGVAMVEFRRNPIDGTAALMEVNGRFWGTSALPLMAGLEFPVYQWQILHGQTPRVPPVYVVGMRWRWTAGYLIRTRRLFSPSSQEAGQVSRWNEFIKIPQDLSPTVRDAVWSVSDPMPGLQEVASTIWDLLKQDCRALLTKLAPARLSREVARFRRFPRVQRPVYLKVKLRNLVAGARDLKKRVPPGARSFVFVCHGNIMRSPLCEALFKRELGPQASDFRVVSAGLHAQEGRSVDPRALVAAREVGISLDGHKAQRLTSDMVQNADVILAMDLQNKVELLTAYPAARRKVFMISSYASPPSRENEIPDPYFGDIEQARSCCKLLFTCIRNLTASLFPERQAQHGVGARCEIEARGEMHSK
jgi:protein-tyrosine-phosphatase